MLSHQKDLARAGGPNPLSKRLSTILAVVSHSQHRSENPTESLAGMRFDTAAMWDLENS
jgi:hypothetical protein